MPRSEAPALAFAAVSEPSPAASPAPAGSSPGPGAPSEHPPAPARAEPWQPSRAADVFLYTAAAVSYIALSIYNKWLLDWVVGPLWLVAWVWGVPALVRLVRRQPVRPQRPWTGGDQ
jgi:hypothetical protein